MMVIPWDFRVAYFQTNTLGLEAENDGKKPFHWVIINFLINIATIWGIASLTLEKTCFDSSTMSYPIRNVPVHTHHIPPPIWYWSDDARLGQPWMNSLVLNMSFAIGISTIQLKKNVGYEENCSVPMVSCRLSLKPIQWPSDDTKNARLCAQWPSDVPGAQEEFSPVFRSSTCLSRDPGATLNPFLLGWRVSRAKNPTVIVVMFTNLAWWVEQMVGYYGFDFCPCHLIRGETTGWAVVTLRAHGFFKHPNG